MTASFDYQGALYHVGVCVPDLEAAMAELGPALGITWAQVVERDQPVWTPDDGADMPGVHHMGMWVDDVAAETERLIRAGWALEMAQRAPDQGYGVMTYVRSPGGFLLEPVSAAVRPRFERWWAGGPFA